MAEFGEKSILKLDTCHPHLVTLAEDVVKVYDVTVISGHRSPEEQEMLFEMGQSKLRGGQSKHNATPSEAVDLAPWPIDWKDLNRFYFVAGLMFQAADHHGIEIRWGGDWNRNMDFKDQNFFDLPHFELVAP